jgi:cell division protein ZipA
VAELRWGLLAFGIVVLIAVYLYSRFKPSIDDRIASISARKEPKIGIVESSDTGDDVEEVEELPPEPAAVELSALAARKIVAIRLMARNSGGFAADELVLALREHGLKHGQFGIFHRPDSEDEYQAEFSVASLVEPGSFDLSRLKKDYYPGVSIFLALPGPADGVEAFDDMVNTARALAKQFDGELLDEQGSTLSLQRQRYLREEVVHFQHQTLSQLGDNTLQHDRQPINFT